MVERRVLLVAVNSRYTHSGPAVFCLRSYLAACGLAAECVEFNINGRLLDMLSVIYERRPDIIGFSCYIWNMQQVVSLSSMVRIVLPECKIVWGGPQMNGLAEHWLRQCPALDWVIEGEGEEAWRLLLQIDLEQELGEVPNLRFRRGAEIIANPKAALLDLNKLPFYYSKQELSELRERIVYYEGSRGCPFSCGFCVSALEPVRYRDLSLVQQELKKLSEAGCKKVKLIDRTFNSDKGRAIEILRFLLEIYRPGICFHLELEPLCLSAELVDILQKAPAGYFQAELGVQSLNREALRAVGRRELRKAAADLIGALITVGNIHIHLDLIAGLPHEGLTSFKQSFAALYAMQPHYLQLGFLKLLPGTPLAAQAETLGLLYAALPPYQVLRTPWLSFAEMEELRLAELGVDDYYNEQPFEELLRAGLMKWEEEGCAAFDFFRELGQADRKLSGTKSLLQRARLLFDFLSELFPQQLLLWQNALRLDLVRDGLRLPDYLQPEDEMQLLREHEAALFKLLPRFLDLPRRKWLKQAAAFRLELPFGGLQPGVYAADYEEPTGLWQRPQLYWLGED